MNLAWKGWTKPQANVKIGDVQIIFFVYRIILLYKVSQAQKRLLDMSPPSSR